MIGAYPFIASYNSLGTARGPRLAIIWHMAEGGGTVGYLSKRNPNGVSVHFVIQKDGKTVRMLRLEQMHTSVRPSAIRTSDDLNGFGATAARAVMGRWANTVASLGPNHASIGVEVEGFAVNGPTAAQVEAIATLYAELLDTYPGIRSLGHRDFADYKACPGRKFPWARVGGHGASAPVTEEPIDMPGLTFVPVPGRPIENGVVVLTLGDEVIRISDRERFTIDRTASRQAVGPVQSVDLGIPGYLVFDLAAVGEAAWVRESQVHFTLPSVGQKTIEVKVNDRVVGSIDV